MILFCSDTHFDDKDRNEYRWGLFPWIKQVIQENNVSTLIHGGDVFHHGDRYTSRLINRFIDNIMDISTGLENIYILKGNHDEIDPNNPYLRWINNIPKLHFFINPLDILIEDKKFLLLPHSRDPISTWESYKELIHQADYITCHQTFNGAVSENGQQLEGVSASIFKETKAKIYSGDIHKSQVLGNITYIGTQYPINFGDSGLFRAILLDPKTGKVEDLIYHSIKKHMLTITTPDDLTKLSINKGDQVKVRLALDDLVHWKDQRDAIIDYCKSNSIDLFEVEAIKKDAVSIIEAQKSKLVAMNPMDLFHRYCELNAIGPETIKYGTEIINTLGEK